MKMEESHRKYKLFFLSKVKSERTKQLEDKKQNRELRATQRKFKIKKQILQKK